MKLAVNKKMVKFLSSLIWYMELEKNLAVASVMTIIS